MEGSMMPTHSAAIRRIGMLFLAAGIFAINAVHAQGVPISSLELGERAEIEHFIEGEIAHLFELMQENGRDVRPTDIRSVRLEPRDQSVHVDMGIALLRQSAVEMEPFLQQVNVIVHSAAEGIVAIRDIHWYFDGKGIYEYFPDEKPQPPRPMPTATTDVVINAGHGWYLHNYPSDTWALQRPFMFGVQEDLLTPEYASVLADLIAERSQMDTRFTRSQSTNLHTPSGNPWREVAARYHLEATLPNEPQIWDGNTGHPNLHYGQDINSRPRYANFINAESMISIHTNGVENPSIRGARVYVAPNRPVDYARAQSMLCYMEEVIQAQDGYEDFIVSPFPHTENLGENTLAQMTAVLVEVAFHSNPDDAAALLDPTFRLASMKGVEKGYRLHKEDRPCTHLGWVGITDGSAAHGDYVVTYATFEGFP